MPNLVDVRLAIKNNETREASRMLASILKEKPSADAWYLAARLTQDREKALTYCKRALMFDGQHKQARLMLIELGGRQLPTQNKALSFTEKVVGYFQDFGDNSPILRPILGKLHPNVRGALVASILVLLIGLNIVLAMSLLGYRSAAPSQPAVQSTSVPTVEATESIIQAPEYQEVDVALSQYQAYFRENGYQLQSMPGYMATTATYQYRIQNTAGTLPYEVYLFFYDTVEAAQNDTYRDVPGATYIHEGYGNAVIYFPMGVDDETADILIELVADLALDAPATENSLDINQANQT